MSISASIRLAVLSLPAMACTGSAQTVREQLKDPAFRVYTVIFGITIGTDSKLQSFRVAEVNEPKNGKSPTVDIQIPDAYISAARKRVQAKPHEPQLKNGKPVEVFTYFYYTPTAPETVITDLDQPLDNQP